MSKLRAYVPACLFILGALFVWNTRTQMAVPLAGSLDGVLADLEGYRMQNVTINEEARRIAGMTNYVSRVYWRDSVPAFTTYVGYYDRQVQGKSIHSPRNCLPGAGWEVVGQETRRVNVDGANHEVNRSLLKKGAMEAVVYYWYQGRGRVVASEYTVKWNLLRDAALLGRSDEALVRIVVPILPGDGRKDGRRDFGEADDLGQAIAATLIRQVHQVLPSANAVVAAGAASPVSRSAGS